MAAGRMRSTRRLRSWIVEQVSSGKYPGVMWDDDAKTMFRIPWKHAGKHDFRQDEDAALFKAWAEFKGKLSKGENNPAAWKTRLRCALNKSPEFKEVMERAQLDISEPYKVYRLVPISEQGVLTPETKSKEKNSKKHKRKSSDSDSSSSSSISQDKRVKTEEVTSQLHVDEDLLQDNKPAQSDGPSQCSSVDEIRLDVRIEESLPATQGDQDSFSVAVHYIGQEVLKRSICGPDVRIVYLPSSSIPPTPAAMNVRFPRILLPEPPSTLPAGGELQALFTLLPFMEKGILLTSTQQGVYGKRYCQGRIFWTGPHTTTPGLHRMERNTEPVLLFSKEIFKQQLDDYRANGGEPPQCGFTLCFGEELSNAEDPSHKLIIVQITLPWAEQQVEDALSFYNTISVFRTLASQSPLGEITLNLVTVPPSELVACQTP
ncbi:PREDICTED: interferon regulatory factor 9 [Cyprinodon variegatus]|nr:PREDICTED: interferon regulatory factor 9 [Cyprinodon variegatus]XP_015237670.1 PREDICTED: interferon regulatory factor 9 [Cyprinodon variegatus]XP_015237672.1 PREDICTED: interferon regulatory factor 9 [Cyprinodon variegatus]